MADIFISYSREDKPKARTLAEALMARGWSVWWDLKIPVGASFDEVIEKALGEAKCVLVLWSAASVASEWVRNEASEGRRRHILVPAFVEAVDAPLAFRLLNGADLSRWQAGTPHAEFDKLIERVTELISVEPWSLPIPPRPKWYRIGLFRLEIRWLVSAGIGVVVLLGSVYFAATLGRGAARFEPPARPPAATPPATTPPAPSPPAPKDLELPGPGTKAPNGPAVPSGMSVQVDSDPAGATIVLDGHDTGQATPSRVTVSGAGPHRLRLSKAGYQSIDVQLADADVRKGPLNYTLRTALASTIAVSVTGPYPFQVFDGTKVISDFSESHDLNVAVDKMLRLVAPDYLLSQPVRVQGTPGKRLDIEAYALGSLNVLTTFETCKVQINDRDLGYPPISNKAVAAGTYRIDLVCPNGETHVGRGVVPPGQSVTVRIF